MRRTALRFCILRSGRLLSICTYTKPSLSLTKAVLTFARDLTHSCASIRPLHIGSSLCIGRLKPVSPLVLRRYTSSSSSITHPNSNGSSLDHYEPYLLSPVPGAERLPSGEAPSRVGGLDSRIIFGESPRFRIDGCGDGSRPIEGFSAIRWSQRAIWLNGDSSYSKLTAYEAARILRRLGCDVRHGNITAVMKNQIDWIPLAIGSVRPTQGKCLAFAQVNGGSQSFNTVNTLRILGRWIKMFVINQSSLPLAWKAFSPAGRLLPSLNRDRIVDVCEELVKVAAILRPHFDRLGDKYSERTEKMAKGRLLMQADKEVEKDGTKA